MDMNDTFPLSSGREVESATLHPPLSGSLSEPMHGEGMRGKLQTLQQRVMETVESVKTTTGTRMEAMRGGMSAKVSHLREGMNAKMMGVQSDIKANPTRWAGVAAGAGLALGLVGRFVMWRASRPMPQLVIIDAC